ncbi:MAG: c-type cytochrome [Chloroflexi bacterium]|nr:c-type cytochrome [Chloroflexota bacterium]
MLTSRNAPNRARRLRRLALVLVVVLVAAGCDNMRDQAKFHDPYAPSETFGAAARNLDPNAVPVGFERTDEHLYEGTVDGRLADSFPFEITRETLEEGQRLYDGFCSACHGYSGYGDGVVAAEGYPMPAPASYHIERLRDMPDGYYFQVITDGFGQMFSLASRIQPEDRWAIVAYVRALQLSQNATFDDLPPELQGEF